MRELTLEEHAALTAQYEHRRRKMWQYGYSELLDIIEDLIWVIWWRNRGARASKTLKEIDDE